MEVVQEVYHRRGKVFFITMTTRNTMIATHDRQQPRSTIFCHIRRDRLRFRNTDPSRTAVRRHEGNPSSCVHVRILLRTLTSVSPSYRPRTSGIVLKEEDFYDGISRWPWYNSSLAVLLFLLPVFSLSLTWTPSHRRLSLICTSPPSH